jgi:hypothetical protein
LVVFIVCVFGSVVTLFYDWWRLVRGLPTISRLCWEHPVLRFLFVVLLVSWHVAGLVGLVLHLYTGGM